MGVPARGFRADINGLRAWAVVAVVLYHFDVPGLQGGFVGVDVFFVISGFLMTGIVLSALHSNHFSLWQFYWARARRIVPALAVLCVVLLVIGWFTLLPSEYRTLAHHARDSLLFASNLRYLRESGYFDVGAHEKWLLHTWSLSVEWQFYMMLPLLLWALWRLSSDRRVIVVGMCLMFAGSLGWCVYLTGGQSERAFFTWQARSWELLAGALVFLLAGATQLPGLLAKRLSWLGLILIVASALFFTPNTAWPGWRALMPVLGAALVLLAHRSDSRWTTSRLAQWLGDRSYSIYLWHWPVVIGIAYIDRMDRPFWIAGGVLLSLLLGHCSFIWVEGPSRRALASRRAATSAAWLVASVLLVAGTAQLIRKVDLPHRLPAEVMQVEQARSDRNPRQEACMGPDANCVYGGNRIRAIVIGDSHADAVVTAVAASLSDSGQGVLFKGAHGCPIISGARSVEGDDRPCTELNDWVAGQLSQSYPGMPVILANRWALYLYGGLADEQDLTPGVPRVYFNARYDEPAPEFLAEFRERFLDTMCRIAEHHPLYLLRPIPEMPRDVPSALGRSLLLGHPKDVSLPLDGYRQRQAFVWQLQDEAAARCGVKTLDPLPYLCNQQACMGSEKGVSLYVDDDHLNETGNRRLIPLFSQLFPGRATPMEPSPGQAGAAR